jgi:hypothetical protein
MKRLLLLGAAAVIAAAPAVTGLVGNASFAQSVPVHVPASARTIDDHGRHVEPGDDRGRHAEPGDDRGRHAEPGDDRGRHAEPGDDRGRQAEPGDDRGRQAEPGDDRGGVSVSSAGTSLQGSRDDHGSGSPRGDDGGSRHGGQDDGSGHR